MITRNAILISCPDRKGSYLPGAVTDPVSIKNYLLSPRGGAWRAEEILTFEEARWETVLLYLKEIQADYQLIFFSGHGCTDETGRRLLQFEDFLIPDTDLLNHNPRQLLICDACRTFVPTISGISPAEDIWDSFTGVSSARYFFDQYIEASAAGKMIVHATQDNRIAEELSGGRGGVFTYHLLQAAIGMDTGREFTMVTIPELLGSANEFVQRAGYLQQAEVVYASGDLHTPFLIDVEQMLVEKQPEALQKTGTVPSVFDPLPLLAFAALILVIGWMAGKNN